MRFLSLYLARLEEDGFNLDFIVGRPQMACTTCTPQLMQHLKDKCPALTDNQVRSLQVRSKYRLYKWKGARYRDSAPSSLH